MRIGSIWVLVLASIACAPCARAADLLDVAAAATAHDADLAAAQAGAKAANQAIPKARAALLPRIDGGWGRAYNGVETSGLPRMTYWQSGWTVSLTQPLFDWTRWTNYQQADLIAARGATELALAGQAVLLRAVRAYFDELAAEDELARTIDYTAAVAAHLDLLQHRQAAGEATVIDLREGEASVQTAQLQQMDAQRDLRVKRVALEQLTGTPFEPLARLTGGPALARLEPADADAWMSQAAAQGYGVQTRQIDWNLARLDIEKARAGYLPVVALTASHTPAGAASGYARPTTTNTAMLSVTIPFFEGGATQARLTETLALEDKARNALTSAQRQAAADAFDAHSRFIASGARGDALARLVKAARSALAATRIGYGAGSRTSADVLRASDAWFTARRDLIRARYETLVALVQLKAATATLTLDELAQVNAQLVPPVAIRDATAP